ncbi:molybdenum cofactor guanylyltransferase [Dokdonella sp.]|uniref:molybdenum cofactor guanylyltransferase n=1 Tax=Dokdonella sp. TaxID=2291710 RepID=UPI002602512F|nr:molybdenum cofactor guanylyltransferase [Dokdonella sp.]
MAAAPLTIAILAGGAATRLGGRDKGLEALLGRPLVAWSLEAAQAMAPESVLIVANRHLDDYAGYGRTVTDDIPGHSGPLAGIAVALASCATPWLMTLPVDCPEPPVDLAARLLAGAIEGMATAVVAHDGERRQPLFALYRSDLASAASLAAIRGQGPWGWQDAIGARELDFADRRAQFRNLNTPEDFIAYAAERSR